MPGRNITDIPLSTDPLADDDLLIVEVDAVGATRSVRFETLGVAPPSSAVPQRSTGTGAAGTSAEYARADHVHPAGLVVETSDNANIVLAAGDSGKVIVLTGTSGRVQIDEGVLGPSNTSGAFNVVIVHRLTSGHVTIQHDDDSWEYYSVAGNSANVYVEDEGKAVALIVTRNDGPGQRDIQVIGPVVAVEPT
jgi:hypothetical protein